MASMASSWDDVVRAASEASSQPRGAPLFLLGLALAPAIALGFPILGVALDVARVRDAGVRARGHASAHAQVQTRKPARARGRVESRVRVVAGSRGRGPVGAWACGRVVAYGPVSYTHLTLPTKA